MDDQPAPKIEYGVTPVEIMASMAGVDFVRAIFEGNFRRRRSWRMSSRSIPPPRTAS